MSKIETNQPWTRVASVYLEEQIARFDREERETVDDDARMVYALCRQALIDQRRPAETDELALSFDRDPDCVISLGCYCAGHASGLSPDKPCDTRERKPERALKLVHAPRRWPTGTR